MRRLYCTFAGRAYDATIRHIVEDAQRFGVSESPLIYDDLWLSKQEFYSLDCNRWLWKAKDQNGINRGFGWYAFKPFINLHALENYCAPGDILLYTDGDTYPIADLSPLYEECVRTGGPILFKAQGCVNKHWVKRDCWTVMGELDHAALGETQHVTGRFMLFQKGGWKTQQFLMEWLAYCLNPLANTVNPSKIFADYPDFSEHRSDQSILTVLAIKYGLRTYREADGFGEASTEDRDLYPRLFTQEYGHGPKEVLGSRFANIP